MGSVCSGVEGMANVDDLTNRSPWDEWCEQMERDSSMQIFTFTPEQYIDFYIKIEEEMGTEKKNMRGAQKPGEDGDAGNPLLFKGIDGRL